MKLAGGAKMLDASAEVARIEFITASKPHFRVEEKFRGLAGSF